MISHGGMLRHESMVLEIESFATVSKTLELSGGRIYLYVGRRDVVGGVVFPSWF